MTDVSASATRWDTPELGGRAFRVLLLYFEKTYGRDRLLEVWKESQLPLSLDFVDDVQNYVSVAFMHRLLDALVVGSRDPGFLEKAGRHIASPDALGFGYYLLRGLGSPALAYEKTVELAPTYNRVGAFKIEERGETHLVLRYSSRIPEPDRRQCTVRKASFAAFPRIWGLPDAEVKESQCLALGADSCLYELTWQARPPLTWRRWVLGTAGALLGTGAVAGSVGSPVLCGAALTVAGFSLGAWLDLRRVTRVKDAQLAEQTQGMTRSIEELQRRADEVHRANVDLDQRVAERTRELGEALERLRRVDSMKSEFFANLSHELRTPLTLILAPVEDRLARATDPAERALLVSLRHNAERLLRLVDDLLELNRIEAGQLRLDVAPIDLAALTRQQLASFEQAAGARGIALLASVPSSTSDVWGDRHRLESVVGNLLGNAVKYTPTGGRITVGLSEREAEVELTVSDTGPGISPEDLPHVFERFYQGTHDSVRRRGGMGIGLALAQNLAELHGGRVTVASVPGQGATFTLTLPRGRGHFRPDVLERRRAQLETPKGRRAEDVSAKSHAEPLPEPPSGVPTRPVPDFAFEGGRRPRVLVVEDQDDLRELLRSLLAPSCDVLLANDGQTGLAIARQALPDLVLTDVMMPVLDGMGLAHAMKGEPALRSTPVLLLTARGGAESALEGFAAGADDYIEKPFHPRVLLARVNAHLRLRAQALQLASQARLATLGTLAAGVGHEVRNPVNAVLNGVRTLLDREGLAPAEQSLLRAVEEGAGRIERISAALLQHASPGDRGGWRPVDVCDGLEATLGLLQHELGGLHIERRFEARPRVVAPAAELNQVFLNLIDNARRAGARCVWLTVREADGKAIVEVADDGPGVPADVVPRLFLPFATGRAPGEGTGLGLYIASESVKRFGGNLGYAPRVGGGAQFTVTLPLEVP
jgi:signal transduction histidine kinase